MTFLTEKNTYTYTKLNSKQKAGENVLSVQHSVNILQIINELLQNFNENIDKGHEQPIIFKSENAFFINSIE